MNKIGGQKLIAKQTLMLEDTYTHKAFGIFMNRRDSATIEYVDGCCYKVVRDIKNNSGDDEGIFNQNCFEIIDKNYNSS